MKMSVQKINSCNSLKELQGRYKTFIIEPIKTTNQFKYLLMPYKKNLVIVVNSNVNENEYIEKLKRDIINAINNI